jgi:ATP-dependent RNA helicase DDX54/DBP10
VWRSVDAQLAFFTMRGESKLAALVCLLRDLIPSPQQTIVFAATRCVLA